MSEPTNDAEELHQAIAGVIRAARTLASWHFAALAAVDPDVYSAVLIDKAALAAALRAFDALPVARRYVPPGDTSA